MEATDDIEKDENFVCIEIVSENLILVGSSLGNLFGFNKNLELLNIFKITEMIGSKLKPIANIKYDAETQYLYVMVHDTEVPGILKYTLQEDNFSLSLIKILPLKGVPSSMCLSQNFILISSQNIVYKFGRYSSKFIGYIDSQNIQTIFTIHTISGDQVVLSGRNFIKDQIFDPSVYSHYMSISGKQEGLNEVIEVYDFNSIV